MYDEYLKSRCELPGHYDRMIALIMLHNSHCTQRAWAINVINVCIRGALEKGGTSTGMCHASKTKDGQVRLFLEPLNDRLDELWEVR